MDDLANSFFRLLISSLITLTFNNKIFKQIKLENKEIYII